MPGILPGPGDIVVNRTELAELSFGECRDERVYKVHKICQMVRKTTDQNKAGSGNRKCWSRVEEGMVLNRRDRKLQCKDEFEQRPEGGEGASLSGTKNISGGENSRYPSLE